MRARWLFLQETKQSKNKIISVLKPGQENKAKETTHALI